MKAHIISAALALISTAQCLAQDNKDFNRFSRTNDSLMHIAFYDKDVVAYKKHFNDYMSGYNALSAKDKQAYKDDMQNEYYNLACAYARSGDRNNAMQSLEQSKFYDYEHLQTDKDLDNLRKDPRFVKYLKTAKAQKPKYVALLEKDTKYSTSKNDIPAFTYQPASDPTLVALKKAFNLDSIAGDGTDISRMINLMEWVHYLVPHDGSKGNPAVKNAMSLISECRRDKKTLNCRGLAILLNEVYLAEGFKSRFVTCLPKDTLDNDCHVINMVWSSSLKKWIWMDPTFMAYVMDENGTLLGLEEVRDRLIHNKPLVINPDANHNRENSETKSDYLEYYMAKNLYRPECPVSSEYNYETREKGKARAYIQLVPWPTLPPAQTKQDENGVKVYALYYTNNTAQFWAAPPTDPIVSTAAKASQYTQADYEQMMNRFKDCYNKKSKENVSDLFLPDTKDWIEGLMPKLPEEYGSMVSCRFIGMEQGDDVALFKVVCDKQMFCTGISLQDSRIGTFRFRTSSPYIDWLLAKATDKEKAQGGKVN